MKITVGETTFNAKYISILQMSGSPELICSYNDSRSMADIVQTWAGNTEITAENDYGDIQTYSGYGDIRRIVRDSDTEVFIGLMKGGSDLG